MQYLEVIGAIFVLLGSFFLLTASIGLLRMPDVFNRIQAGTKASTLGTLLVLLGIGFTHPGWWGRLLIIAVFILITVPVSNHVIARAAYHHRQEKGRFFRDDLGSPAEKAKEETP